MDTARQARRSLVASKPRSRFYFHCSRCRTRMRAFTDYPSVRYYFCPRCGKQVCYNWRARFALDGWPLSLIRDAIRLEVLDEAGRAVRASSDGARARRLR